MTNGEFLEDIKNTFDSCYTLLLSKNYDYSSEENPFKNFMNSKFIDIEPEKGILIRVMDKIARINNLLERDPKVINEKIDDTINDTIGYLAILKTLIKNK